MYQARVEVPSVEGMCYIPITRSIEAKVMHDHGKRNVNNVLILCQAWTTLIADTPFGASTKTRRQYRKFFYEFLDDALSIIDGYSKLADRLMKTLVYTEGSVSITEFLIEFKDTPIFYEYLKFYRSLDVDLLRFILSFLLFGKKLFYQDESLNANALRDWLEVENRLGEIRFDSDILKALRTVMYELTKEFEFGPLLPIHGSGAVSEPGVLGVISKSFEIQSHPKIDRLLGWSGVPVWRTHPEGSSAYKGSFSRAYSRLKFVPKDLRKTRSICMEPVIFMYYQQAVRQWYEKGISDSWLGRFVRIDDQTVNQESAVFGAEFALVDTIDLSSASDSVSWSLVKAIFPPGIAKYLAATRTAYVDVPDQDQPVKVNKFAPMGSALCFPVQSTLYSAVVILASYMVREGLGLAEVCDINLDDLKRTMHRLYYNDHTFLSQKFQPFRVYGDDIICDSRITSTTIALLRSLGFIVNEEKSFVGNTAIRESCGIYAFAGEDVTPLRFKIKNIDRKLKVEALAGIIDLCNRAYSYGYLNLRRLMKNIAIYYPILNVKADRSGRNPILFSDNKDDQLAILTTDPRNTHLRRRIFDGTPYDDTHHKDSRYAYQRDEVRSVGITVAHKQELPEELDNYRYVEWQRSRVSCEENLGLKPKHKRLDARGARVYRRWTPI